MKFLVYGSNGWIGQQVILYLKSEKLNYELGQARVDDISEVEKEMNHIKPTNVICLIGRTHGKIDDTVYPTIDYLEQQGKLVDNMRDNLFSPMVLAMSCRKRFIHLTYLGTGCIFKYDEEHPEGSDNGFRESDIPNFFDSSYSIVKGFTDRLMHLFPDTVLNLRIRMPITSVSQPRNFITKITSYKKICSVPNSMTVLDDMIPLIIDLSQKKATGTINLVNPGTISHNEILEMYRDIVDPDFTWENFTYEEQMEILAAGRSNNYLDTTELETFCEVLPIRESIRRCLERMADQK